MSLDDALCALDRAWAVSLASQALEDGSVSLHELYDLLAGILVDLGSAWQSGTAEVWQEHAVTGIVRTIVEACIHEVEAAAPVERPATVVLAAPSDEYHDLGLRMLADRFTLAGWRAHFLGANVPLAQVRWAVQELSADAVAHDPGVRPRSGRARDRQ
ncbi:MAG: B12-binding domain-containing protein, partial [Nitriliruptoraceae bacterium]